MKEYKLNVDPRILELLGPNLYTNIYYVLSELIANAYDADASNVYIVSGKDDIRVEDDGHGMSYVGGDVAKFLNVAGISRSGEGDSMTKSGRRFKMGRKGVGKLAALSVSECVEVLTIANEERSGFVLTRRPKNGNELEALRDENIRLLYVRSSGTAIVMKNPQYQLSGSLDTVKKNLLKIFPLLGDDFKIHIIRGKEHLVVSRFDERVMTELGAFISLGEEFGKLADFVPDKFPSRRAELVEKRERYVKDVRLRNNEGTTLNYPLEIKGWIGVYASTRGRKAKVADFPDNFISLYANGKLGEFNILPIVSRNNLNEVYVVGQLHIDLFEQSKLPDMALSNRQGYKSDDPRYESVITYIRDVLLPDILRKRSIFADEKRKSRQLLKLDSQKKKEAQFKKDVDAFRKNVSENIAIKLEALGISSSKEDIGKIISDTINSNSKDLGLKPVVDSQKKKILISHASNDKLLADLIYSFLLYNGVPASDILYTSCDDEKSRIPEGVVSIYEYLRDFFVESYSNQKIFVIFVTSENTPNAWGAMTEIGASWITQVGNKIFNIPPFRPQHPLNDEALWHNTSRNQDGELVMDRVNADIFCQKIENICSSLGFEHRSREENMGRLKDSVVVYS